jgi:hypothetical protein
MATNLVIYYALPGTGYLTAANQMVVYESKPTIAMTAGSPSGARSVAAADDAFLFTIGANAQEDITIRAGVELTASSGFDSAGANNTALAAATDAGDSVDGSAVLAALDNHLATDSISMVSASDLSGYARLNFWFKYTGAAVPPFVNLQTNVTASATADPASGAVDLSAALCGADGSTAVTTEWYNCDISIAAVAASGDTFFHLIIEDSTGLTFAADTIHLDRVIAYNEKLTVDVSTDTDLDTYANNAANAGAPSAALLKEGGSTVATAYVDTLSNGASATTTAKAVFIPTTDIVIAKGTSKNFTLTVNSSNILAEDAGSDDPVTFSIDLGTSSGGTVTAGDFWWYETNATVKWLGQVANTTLNSGTLVY